MQRRVRKSRVECPSWRECGRIPFHLTVSLIAKYSEIQVFEVRKNRYDLVLIAKCGNQRNNFVTASNSSVSISKTLFTSNDGAVRVR